MVMFNSAYKVWSVGSYLFDIKNCSLGRKASTKQTKTKLHNIHVQSYKGHYT